MFTMRKLLGQTGRQIQLLLFIGHDLNKPKTIHVFSNISKII